MLREVYLPLRSGALLLSAFASLSLVLSISYLPHIDFARRDGADLALHYFGGTPDSSRLVLLAVAAGQPALTAGQPQCRNLTQAHSTLDLDLPEYVLTQATEFEDWLQLQGKAKLAGSCQLDRDHSIYALPLQDMPAAAEAYVYKLYTLDSYRAKDGKEYVIQRGSFIDLTDVVLHGSTYRVRHGCYPLDVLLGLPAYALLSLLPVLLPILAACLFWIRLWRRRRPAPA